MRVEVYIPDGLLKNLKDIQERRGGSQSSLIVEILYAYVADHSVKIEEKESIFEPRVPRKGCWEG